MRDTASMQEDNVRVAVRVRPLLPKEKLAGEQICLKIVPKTNQLVLGKDRAFTFDHVLSSKTNQETIYKTCMDQLVKACFDGYNATVFAYGQTGSGKTFTIGGGNIASQTEDEFGILPRTIKHMYENIEAKPNVEFTVKVSYIEIYKEELRDLLDPDTSSKDLHIREDEKGNTLIIGASEVECSGQDEVMTALEQGSLVRHTGSTQMNEHSSRSHSVFTMLIEQRWIDSDESSEKPHSRLKSDDSEIVIEEAGDPEHYMCSKFHFVDLAGSERADRTGNVGDRFKESVHINSGLLALGNVISALGDTKKKITYIPYRDSKITRLLKDSLGGNAKTVMICCISPSSSNLDESLNALKYANRARNIKNKPVVNRDPQSIRFEEMQTEIRTLRAELQRQRTSLATGMNFDLNKAMQDTGQFKVMEDKVSKMQTECQHYKMIADEAYKQLTDIKDKDILSRSQNVRLRDWLELMEEIKNKVPDSLNRETWENQTIVRLEGELKQCKNDLKSDEEIFAEKAREMSSLHDVIKHLKESNAELSKHVEELEVRLKQQVEQLVEKEMRIAELTDKLKEQDHSTIDVDGSLSLSSGPPTTNRRAKSVPVNMLGDHFKEEAQRRIHTSPAVFSLERVMQRFRARSQLLVSQLEESDEVCQPHFSDDSVRSSGAESDDDDVIVGGTSNDVIEGKASGRSAFDRADNKRSTYKVNRPKLNRPTIHVNGSMDEDLSDLRRSQTDDEKLNSRSGRFSKTHTLSKGDQSSDSESQAKAELQKKRLKQTELQVRQSTQKMRDLAINIRMKEQLIKELVKTGKESQQMNKQYEAKITALEAEKQHERQELQRLTKALEELEQYKLQDKADKERLQNKFLKKMELAKSRINMLQKQQRETEKMANISSHAEKRIQDLEIAIVRMREQQEQLQRKLKEETDHKLKLEREMSKEQQRIKELEIRTEQQKKVLRVKTDEMTAMTKKLRSGPQQLTASTSDERSRLEDQKKWLEQEQELILQQRLKIDHLKKELAQREDIIARKESMLAEKSELDIKILRSSQVVNKDMLTVSNKLELVDQKIGEKSREVAATPRGETQIRLQEELIKMQQSRDRYAKQKMTLDKKMKEGSFLSQQEERRLIEIEEGLDALDAAIEYKNETIRQQQEEIRRSVVSNKNENHLMVKLQSLSAAETRVLLSRYFEKVIDLREAERHHQLRCSELEMKMEEQDRVLSEMETSLQRAGLERDRLVTQKQQEYERKIQLLVKQLAENQSSSSSTKVLQLEKDLYYYKKTSREWKRKYRELMAGSGLEGSDNGDLSQASTPRDNLTPHDLPSSKGQDHGDSGGGTPRVSSAAQHHDLLWDKLNQVRESSVPIGGAGHVRISRKELRRMSEEEVCLRKSAAQLNDTPLPTDSLEVDNIPRS